MIEKRLVSLVCIINEEKSILMLIWLIMITISKPEIFFTVSPSGAEPDSTPVLPRKKLSCWKLPHLH